MKRTPIAVAGAALIVLGTLAAPAYADCAADIQKVEVDAKKLPQSGKTMGGRTKIDELVGEARKLIGKKKKKKCANLMKKARNIITTIELQN